MERMFPWERKRVWFRLTNEENRNTWLTTLPNTKFLEKLPSSVLAMFTGSARL